MYKLITIVLIALLSSPSFAVETVKCQKLWWKLTVKGKPATYRGTVKAGSANVIYVEVRKKIGRDIYGDRFRIVGQAKGFPNPGGTWGITVWGDDKIDAKNFIKFHCEKYTNDYELMGAIIEQLEQELQLHKRSH